MKCRLIILLCVVLASCAGNNIATPDPIDKLVGTLNASNGLWINGVFPIITLPVDATPEDVLAQAVKMVGFDQGHIKTYRILKIREVDLKNVPMGAAYSAALVQTDLGMKICLFKQLPNSRWWTRWYDVRNEEPNTNLFQARA
jgi:hypothetical protein